MFQFKRIYACSMIMAMLFVLSCKSPEESKVSLAENDIPVGVTSDEAMKEFVQGLKHYDRNEFIKARKHFKKSVEIDPEFVSGHMYHAFTSNSAKAWSENRDKFLSMRDKANEAEKIQMDWLVADMEGNTARELELIKTMVEKYPKSARAMDYLASYYNGRDDVSKAREIWLKAHELDPEFIPVITGLGFSYRFNSPKDFQKSQKYSQMVVDLAPESSQARIWLGDSYRAQGNLNKALENYLKAAELDPENQTAHSKAGHANTFMGNYDEARKNFRDARAVSEFGTGSYNFEAYTYLYEGDHKKALAFLEDGAKMFEQMDIPASNKNGAKMGCANDCAMIAMHYGDADHLKELVGMMKPMSEQFIAEINDEVSTKYQRANMHYWDAIASLTEGDYEAAAAKAEMIRTTLKTVDDPTKDRSYHRVHALVNFKTGKYEKAIEHLAKLDEDNIYDKYWMAKAYKMLGEEDKAVKLFQEVVDNNFNSVAYALVLNESKEAVAAAK